MFPTGLIHLVIEILIILAEFDALVKDFHTFPNLSLKYICQIDKAFAHDNDLVAERSEEIAYPLAGIIVRGVQPNRPEEMHRFWQILSYARGSCTTLQLGASVLQNAQILDIRFCFVYAVVDLVPQHQELAYISGLSSH